MTNGSGRIIEGEVIGKEVEQVVRSTASPAAAASDYPWWVIVLSLGVAAMAFFSWLGVTPPVCEAACVFNWVAGLAATGFLFIGLRYLFGRLRERRGRKAVLASAVLAAVAYGIVMSPKSGLSAPIAQEPVWLVVAALVLATLVAWARR